MSAEPSKVVWKGPVSVLIDGTTSGAAEVLASAIVANKRGDVVGERTFGLASEQKLITMDDGSALFLTVANYFNAAGKPILEDGVEPTEVVRAAADTDDDGDDDSATTSTPSKSKEYGPRPLSPEDQIYRKALDLLKNPGAPLYVFGRACATEFQGLGVLSAEEPCPGGKGLNPAAFGVPPSGQQGNEGRDDIPGFGFTQVDLSLGRKFQITDRLNLQFRADAFNALNHPNFSNPGALFIPFAPSYLLSTSMLNQGLGGLNPLFQEGGPRSLQLSLKLAF